MHHFVVKFSKFSSPQAAKGHWSLNQNPANALVLELLIWNDSAPIQLAQCQVRRLAISDAKVLICFSNKMHGSNFIEQQFCQTALGTVMVWNYQNTDCSLYVLFLIIFGTLSFPVDGSYAYVAELGPVGSEYKHFPCNLVWSVYYFLQKYRYSSYAFSRIRSTRTSGHIAWCAERLSIDNLPYVVFWCLSYIVLFCFLCNSVMDKVAHSYL